MRRNFRLTALQDNARMRDYADAFFWLNDAKIIYLFISLAKVAKLAK
ncbi:MULTISPECIES: hypothetical protein [Bacteroides]|jgi:hypothetical protein|nr:MULTISPECIES: hypothetical protein [Bacteroides]MCS3094488.1 hypothetical protein [Bacteroides thetaiotaomicron]